MESEVDTKATTANISSKDQRVNGRDRPRSTASESARHDTRNLDSRPDTEAKGRYMRSDNDSVPGRYQQGSKRKHREVEDHSDSHLDSRRLKPEHEDNGRVNGGHQRLEETRSGPREPDHRVESRMFSDTVRCVDRLCGAVDDTLTMYSSAGVSTDADDHDYSEAPVMDEAALIEARRKRREALRAKHKAAAPLLQQALDTAAAAAPVAVTERLTDEGAKASSRAASPVLSSPATPRPDEADSPMAISVQDDGELANDGEIGGADPTEGPSAADYDPSMDMQEDRVGAARTSVSHAEVEDNPRLALKRSADATSNFKKKAPTEKEFDMFADDVEDESDDGNMEPSKDNAAQVAEGMIGRQLDKNLLDDWDDSEGYYRIILGELLDKRYLVQSNLGKGVFSAVIRALDQKADKTVAIKIIRRQETMYKAGLKEIRTLEKLCEADPEDKKHVIRLERHFMHKGHLCMVFENLSINLREVLKKFGRDVGINIKAVRAYAQQMFLGLSLLKKCDVLHADLKPDNVLVNENRSRLKIADLGSAFDLQDSEVTDVLVSRFYRAPEIMLGLKGDFALDMWSIGCTLFELYTGRIAFTGSTNNQMLKAIIECRGKVPNRVLKRAEYYGQHFEADGSFLSQEFDTVTQEDVVRRLTIARPTPAKELKARVFAGAKNLGLEQAKELSLFVDLLDRCLSLDPLRRITPNEALRHEFISRSAAAAAPSAKATTAFKAR